MSNKLKYGLCPQSLKAKENHLQKCTQLELYLRIRENGGCINFLFDDFGDVGCEEFGISEEKYILFYLIYMTERFGVRITENIRSGRIKVNEPFWNWFTWCDYYVENNIIPEEQESIRQKISKAEDISEYEIPHIWEERLTPKKHRIIYDERYLGPGYFIYSNDNSKFLKFYHDNNYGFNQYHMSAIDKNVDIPDENYRDIIFEVGENDILFSPLSDLYKSLGKQTLTTIDPSRQGTNHFKILRTRPECYAILLRKDVLGVKEATDSIDVFIGDNCSCSNYPAINNFFHQLDSFVEQKDSEEIKPQVLALRR